MLDLWRGSIHTSQLCSSQWQVADYRNLLVVVVTWWKRGSPTGSEHVHEKWNVFKAYIAEHDQHYHGSKALETMILPIEGGGRLWESSEMFWGSASSTETETLFRKQIPFACKKRRLSCGFYPFRWTFFTCTCNMDDLTCNKNGNLFVINLSLRFGQFMVGWQVFWRGTQMNSCYCWLGTTCVRRNLSLYGLCLIFVMWAHEWKMQNLEVENGLEITVALEILGRFPWFPWVFFQISRLPHKSCDFLRFHEVKECSAFAKNVCHMLSASVGDPGDGNTKTAVIKY